MSLSQDDIHKIAHLARLNLSEQEIAHFGPQLSGILALIAQMDQVNTNEIEPLSHPLDLSQRLRPDTITEQDCREKFQEIAPRVEAGLYLVPKVIEEA